MSARATRDVAPSAAVARLVFVAALAVAPVLSGAVSGCASYRGGGEPIAASAVAPDDGWVHADDTPTVRQRNLTDCGAAALAMVAGHWGKALTLDEAAARLPPPGKEGVRLRDLRDAARTLGLSAFADLAVVRHEIDEGRPVIVGLLRPMSRRKASSHFEVVVAYRSAPPAAGTSGKAPELELVTIDPGSGHMVRTWTELEAEWKLAGRPALVVVGPEPTASARP